MDRSRQSIKLVVFVLIAAALAACAGGPHMIAAEREAKAGSDSLVVFLRPNPLPAGQDFSLWDRGHFIGFLGPVTSVTYRVKPGEHLFLVKAENWEIVKGRVATGRTYYLWVDQRAAGKTTRTSVSVLDPTDRRVRQWTAACKPITLEDPAKGESIEKKNERALAKAIAGVESGKARFTTLTVSQGGK